MTFEEYIYRLAALLVIPPDDDRFVTLVPWIIETTELAMLRDPDLDFLAARGPPVGSLTVLGSREAPIPLTINIVEKVNLILPKDQGNPVLGERVPLLRVTRNFIDMIWPDEGEVRRPAWGSTYFTINDQFNPTSVFLIAPTPDGAYYLEVYGTHRPDSLSIDRPQTFLSFMLPDMFLMKSAVIAAGSVLKNFGAASDNPQQAMSWEQAYQDAKRGAVVESMRQRAMSSGWSPFPPSSLAPISRSAQLVPSGTGR